MDKELSLYTRLQAEYARLDELKKRAVKENRHAVMLAIGRAMLEITDALWLLAEEARRTD
jgi:hypothetical protein